MIKWEKLASEASIKKAAAALKQNGIEAIVVENGAAAKKKVLEIIPKGVPVMDMTSVTLETIGVTAAIQESGDFEPLKKKLYAMDRKTQSREMQMLGASPEWTVGSVHAVTEDGKVMFASNTGSQLPAYAYGSDHVIWVVGTQKIVKNFDEGLKRIYEHCLPLESERAKKAYGVSGSAVNKLLTINHEVKPGRLTIIFVREKLGF